MRKFHTARSNKAHRPRARGYMIYTSFQPLSHKSREATRRVGMSSKAIKAVVSRVTAPNPFYWISGTKDTRRRSGQHETGTFHVWPFTYLWGLGLHSRKIEATLHELSIDRGGLRWAHITATTPKQNIGIVSCMLIRNIG